MKGSIQAGCDRRSARILRLRGDCAALAATSLRMTLLWITVIIVSILSCKRASATTYYVSNSGADTNNGTSATSPWQTLAKVNGSTFSAGDTIYLQRGGVWNEQLIPPSSGGNGSPITFDAYGTGPAPVITAMAAINGGFSAAAWTHISGSVWATNNTPGVTTAMGAATTVDMVQFGNVWGRHQPYGTGCTATVVGKYDWCIVYPKVYVYSPSGTNPASYYSLDGSITPYVDSGAGLPLISVVGKTWLVFQHIKLQGFSYMGVSVTGNSDNLVFANMESDGMLPYGATPHGFYVNVNSGYGTNIQFLNDDAFLNYDGFRIDKAAGATITNCRGYANRDAGLKDTTGAVPSPVTYSYSHFYGNNIAQFPTADVVANQGVAGPIVGAGNVSSTIPPVSVNFRTYPARFSFTVDDVGNSTGTEAYINSFLGLFSSRGLNFNAAVVPSYAGQNGENAVDWASVNNWYASGNEIDSHSWSHQYYTANTNPQNTTPYPNAPALDIQYTGTGTAATLTISGNVLTTNVTGASGDNLNINLASTPYNTMVGLESYLAGLSHYSVSYDQSGPVVRPNTHTSNLLSVANQNIKGTTLVLLYDQTKLEPDEMMASQSAIQANVSGLSEKFYVYPDGIEDPTIEADAVAAGYTAARGSLAMKGQDNTTATANSLYSNGVNVQNLTSLGAIQIHGLTQAQTNQMVQSLVFRAAAWGVPYGFFTHYNTRQDNTPDISNTELGYLLDAVTANGGVWMTNTALANAVTACGPPLNCTNFSGSTRYVQNPAGRAVNLGVAGANSPSVGSGVATAYPIDLNGANRTTLGAWDIGASSYLSQRYGMGSGSGNTTVGGWTAPCGWPTYSCGSTALSAITYPSTAPNVGGLTGAGTTFVDPVFGTPGVRVTDAAFDPSMSGSSNNVYSVSNGGSADNTWWSTDSKLTLVTNGGSSRYLVGINPDTLQITRPYAAATSGCPRGSGNCSSYGGWSTTGDVEFSQANPCELYVFQNGATITSYTFGNDVLPFANACSTAISGPPTPVTLVSLAGGNGLPSDFGTPSWNSEAGTTAGDAVFGEAFSSSAYHYGSSTGQGSGYYIAVWSPAKGVMAYNTQTGVITADTGWAGGSGLSCTATQCTGTVSGPTFTIHNVKFNADGSRLYIAFTTCITGTCMASTPFVWIIGTTTVYGSEGTYRTSGHWCGGYSGIINEPGTPLWQWYYRTNPASGTPGTPTMLNTLPSPDATTALDTHCGWQTDNTSDTGPFVWASTPASLQSSGLMPFDQPRAPWWNEIDLTDTNGDGLTHRVALTFNTGYSTSFAAANNITTASKRCMATSSDWFNLRNAGGTTTSCIESGPTWSAGYSYAANYVVNPASAYNAGNYSYQTFSACASGGTQPAPWNQTVGGTQTDGSCSWVNIGVATGANKCGTDVFAWCFGPQPGLQNFFGVHYNHSSSLFPVPLPLSFPLVRLWDTNTGWADMQTNAGCTSTVTSGCKFSQLDTWLAKFQGERVILTLAKTPNFIASNTSDASCSYTSTLGSPNGSCTPPTDLNCDGTGTDATWIQFLTAMWNHLNAAGTANQVTYLEIWNEFNVAGFWDSAYIQTSKCSGYSDPIQKMLIRLTQDAQCVTQAKNCSVYGTYPATGMHPATLIMSPPVNGPASGNTPYTNGGTEYKLLADGVGMYADVISTHGYVTTSTTCAAPSNANCSVPEAMDSAISVLKADMAADGISKPIAITEFSWGATSGTNDAQYEQAFVGRYYTLMAQDGVMSASWYNLDGSTNCAAAPSLLSNNSTGTLCPTGAAIEVIEGWLNGATFLQPSYTKTARGDCGAGQNVYEFPITLASGKLARIVYYDGMADTVSCSYTIPSLGFSSYTDMTGAVHALNGGTAIVLDNRPVLLSTP